MFAGQVVGRDVAIFLAILIAIENFFFIPYYPFWSILMIALCVWVVWALTRPEPSDDLSRVTRASDGHRGAAGGRAPTPRGLPAPGPNHP